MATRRSTRSASVLIRIQHREYIFLFALDGRATEPECVNTIHSDGETITHLLKASLGTGILAMPVAFMYSGLALGIFATVLTALVCTHCSYILVCTSWRLIEKTIQPTLSPSDIHIHYR